MVESQPSKLLVAGSIPVSRSRSSEVFREADVAQLVEHSLGKGEVTSSILVIGSRVQALRGGSEAGSPLPKSRAKRGNPGALKENDADV